MTDKKIIFSAVILSLFLIGGAWYYSEQLPTASISGAIPSSSPSTVALEAGILIGDPNAPVTMEEYTNFLCSACARFAVTTLPQIKEDYVKTGKVKIVIYVLPPYELSQAALC
ncbi:DsbA family protein, partial [Patescibacteria group bacterium]|nr:DsbA family protein [Patescibacteria group bacterium]